MAIVKYILEDDYIREQAGKDMYIKFIKANFGYTLEDSDDIKIEGDIQVK